MREYALVSKNGTVINMCLTRKAEGPSTAGIPWGAKWVPVNQVSPNALRTYKYWNERP